jgi:hypothetical protein
MPRAIRERPRRTGVATVAVIVVLAVGWLAGVGIAGSTPRPRSQITTVVSTATETVTQTVTAAARRPPTRAVQARHRRMGRSERSKRHSKR